MPVRSHARQPSDMALNPEGFLCLLARGLEIQHALLAVVSRATRLGYVYHPSLPDMHPCGALDPGPLFCFAVFV